MFSFTCNVCNSACSVDSEADVGREKPSCSTCGSCARFRWIIHALSLELFGQSVPLPLFPLAKDLAGIGLTDSPSIADRLVEQLNYTNTFYHQEPRIDIMDLASGVDGAYDFIIASEVFEHLPPPVSRHSITSGVSCARMDSSSLPFRGAPMVIPRNTFPTSTTGKLRTCEVARSW